MTATIIDLASVRDQRRADAIKQERAESQRAQNETEKRALTAKLGGSPGAALVADVLVEAREQEKEQERAGKYMPAYCDPENETRGAKYEATRSLDIKDIAKRMRADIKAAKLPKGVKVSVRIDRFSGGQSIDIRVKSIPAHWNFYSDAFASWQKQFPHAAHRFPGDVEAQTGPEVHALRKQLEAIHGAYNRDNSDSMSDYFDVRYYGHVSIYPDDKYQRQQAEIEAARGDYWAESCA